MSDIKLNFINQSNDKNNSSVVIFQQNVATGFDEIAVAWKVIENCARLDNHPFTFPMDYTANVEDSWGNPTSKIEVNTGSLYKTSMTPGGLTLAYATPATSINEIQVRHELNKGAINENIFKDGKLLATKTAVTSMQKAVFEFKPSIWIGVVSGVGEGDIMNSAIIQSINTELSLLGVQSADIVMTGGGTKPFEFTLKNIVKA